MVDGFVGLDVFETGIVGVHFFSPLFLGGGVRIFLIQTYAITDTWYYDSTTHNWGSSEQTINKNIDLPSVPFKIKFKINKQNYNSCFSYLYIGSSSSTYRVGDVSSGSGIMIYSDYNSQTLTSNIKPSLNTDVEVVYTYDTGVHTISANGTTLTATDTNISMDKLVKITGKANVLKDLMILPL